MKAIEFPEVNVRIAENQSEYETVPSNVRRYGNTSMCEVTTCFQLDEEERKQVAETGCVWLTILQPETSDFHPIKTSFLKPEYMSEYCSCTPDETTGWTEFDGQMKCNICGKPVDPKKIEETLKINTNEQN
jgi:hypothetical protein